MGRWGLCSPSSAPWRGDWEVEMQTSSTIASPASWAGRYSGTCVRPSPTRLSLLRWLPVRPLFCFIRVAVLIEVDVVLIVVVGVVVVVVFVLIVEFEVVVVVVVVVVVAVVVAVVVV